MLNRALTALLLICGLLAAATVPAAAQELPKVQSPTPMYLDRYTPEELANLELAAALVDAYARGNIDFIVSNMRDDVVWTMNSHVNAPDNFDTVSGTAELRAQLEELASTMELESVELMALYVDGDTVVVITREKNRVLATNRQIDEYVALVMTFVDGRVSQVLGFFDTAQEMHAMTPAPEG